MRSLLEFYTATQIGGVYLNVLTYALLLAACWLYTLAKGGAPERIDATILLVASAFSALVISDPTTSFMSVETGVLIVDSLCLAAFVVLALRAERFWPLWVSALQLLTLAAHGVKLVEPETIRRAYAFLMVIWSYPMIFLIIAGTWRHQRRLLRFGYDQAWSPLKRPRQ